MRCEHARDLAVLAPSDDVTSDEHLALEEHLTDCAGCAAELATTGRMLSAVSTLSAALDDLRVVADSRSPPHEQWATGWLLPVGLLASLVFAAALFFGAFGKHDATVPAASTSTDFGPRVETTPPPTRPVGQTLVRLRINPGTQAVEVVELGILPPPQRVILASKPATPLESWDHESSPLAFADARWIVLEVVPRRILDPEETVRVPSGLTASGRHCPDLRVVRGSSDDSWLLCETSR